MPVSSVGAALGQRRPRDADGVRLGPDVALAVDLDVEPRRQRVDDRDADAVQAAGDLVAAAAELAAGVQHGEHDLDRGLALALDDVDRDAAAVVGDADAAVGEQRDLDPVAVPGQRLVDRVVDHLVDQVVQAALAGRADVHARALADRLEPLEHLDVAGVVGDGSRCRRSPGRLRWVGSVGWAGWVTDHLSSRTGRQARRSQRAAEAVAGTPAEAAFILPVRRTRIGLQGRLGTVSRPEPGWGWLPPRARGSGGVPVAACVER